MPIALAANMRPDILLTALSSRLADLQRSGLSNPDGSISPPAEKSPEAGRRAVVASHMIAVLEQRLEYGDPGFVSVSVVTELVSADLQDVTVEEVRFAARFLDVGQEIHHGVVVDGRFEPVKTELWSRLVRYQPRYDRVMLTDAGKLWTRVLRHSDNWLFEDKEIEKLVVAIKGDLFGQIPGIARQCVSSLRQFNVELTGITESPSFRQLVQQYLDRREHFSSMIDRSHAAVLDAKDLIFSDGVQRRHVEWHAVQDEDAPSLVELLEHVNRVHVALESLRRSWAGLLDLVQQDKRPVVGLLRFDRAIDGYLAEPPSAEVDRLMLDGIGGWGNPAPFFSGFDLTGTLVDEGQRHEPAARIFEIADRPDRQAFRSWLQNNRAFLVSTLGDGLPRSLFDLLEASGQLETLPAALPGLFTLYVGTEPLGGRQSVRVEARDRLVTKDLGDRIVTMSDVVIRLV